MGDTSHVTPRGRGYMSCDSSPDAEHMHGAHDCSGQLDKEVQIVYCPARWRVGSNTPVYRNVVIQT